MACILTKLILPGIFCCCVTSQAAEFSLPASGDGIVGQKTNLTSHYHDNFAQLADQHDVGFLALAAANPDLNPSFPGIGTNIILPTAFILPPSSQPGIVINLAELRLYYYSEHQPTVYSFPIGIGKQGWDTPVGNTRISQIARNPSWTPPPSIVAEHKKAGIFLPAIVPAGPDNPLGELALRLGMPGYLLHGTNNESGVGLRVSHGCIRLRNRDIETLAAMVRVGTPVSIINEPYKAAWHRDNLYIEAHRPLDDLHNDAETNKTTIAAQMKAVLTPVVSKRKWPGKTDQLTDRIVELALDNDNLYSGIPEVIPLEKLTGQWTGNNPQAKNQPEEIVSTN